MKNSPTEASLRCAIVSLRIPGASWIRATEWSIKAYAERFGLEVIKLDTRKLDLRVLRWRRRWRNLHLEKFQLYDLLAEFDRVLYVDADILIHPEAPNIFEAVPPDSLGVVDEHFGSEAPKRQQEWRRMQRRLGSLGEMPDRYFNAGMLVASRGHRDLFNYHSLKLAGGRWPDQNTLNYYALQMGIPLHWLPDTWNCMPVSGGRFSDPSLRRQSWIIHYAGEPAKSELQADLAFFGHSPEAGHCS